MSDSHHVVCGDCDAVNRIPTGRLGDNPVCGKCAQPLFKAGSFALTAASFDKHVSRNDGALLVDFWAPWCGPCKAMAPAFEQAAAQLEPAIRLAKVDTEAQSALAARFNIRSIPTLALFAKGREIARQPGAMGVADIVQWVRSQIKT